MSEAIGEDHILITLYIHIHDFKDFMLSLNEPIAIVLKCSLIPIERVKLLGASLPIIITTQLYATLLHTVHFGMIIFTRPENNERFS